MAEWVKHSRLLFVSHWKTEKSVLVFIYETYRATSSVCNDTTYLCILCHEWIELILIRTMIFSESKSFVAPKLNQILYFLLKPTQTYKT